MQANDDEPPECRLKTARLDIDIEEKNDGLIEVKAYRQDYDECVGVAEISLQTKTYGKAGDISYEIFANKRGRGYATEMLRAIIAYAYAELGLVNLYGVAEKNNLAAQYVLQRTGFVFNDQISDGTLLYEAWNPRFQTAR